MMESKTARRNADLEALLAISRRLGATTELAPLLTQIAEAAIGVLGCERATVFLYDRAKHELYSKVATGAGEIRFSADLGIAGDCVRTGQTLHVADAYADQRFNREIDKATGFVTRNLFCLPLRGHDDELVGVLQLLNRKSGEVTADEEQLATTLSLQAGAAIQRQMLLDELATKQKLERDLALARVIQQSQLPRRDPRADGYDIAGFNAPADDTGGDCYDYLELEDGKIGLMIADATGHGIGPALVVAQFRAMIHALARGSTGIIAAVERVNDVLHADLPEGLFVTSFVGALDPPTGMVHYISTGHGPLLHYQRAGDQEVEHAATTVPLGIMSPLPSAEGSAINMASGDVFLLMTDGFFEWASPDGERFGTRRIFDVVRRHPSATAKELIALIRDELQTFCQGTPQADDLTAIVIKKL
jgi:phosphoserine phosphatase